MFAILLAVSTTTFAQDEFKIYDEGLTHFKAGEYDKVIQKFSAILAQPKHNKRLDEDLYFYRGQAYYFQNDLTNALTDLDKALAMDHFNKGTIYMFKARCADKQGNKGEAEALFADALTAAERNKKLTIQILSDRAAFFSKHGNKTASQNDLTRVKALESNNPELAKAIDTNTAEKDKSEAMKTQVIVKPNEPKGKTETAQRTTDKKKDDKSSKADAKAEPEAQTSNSLGVVSALAQQYKDEKRYALVIGNSNYNKEIGVLKNPVNDATDVATELRKSDFEVQLLTNASYIQIREAMRKFQERLSNGPKDQTVGLFYYAGHGVQFQDENYLVPIDANVKFEDDIVRMCFPVQRMVLNNMENTNSRMNIIILDACRNNPFPATTRSVSGGLTEMKRARGSFIAYATAPGSVASDGTGRNGLYTQELLKALRKPGLTIEQVFKEVRMNVLKLSGEKQYTWDSSNIIGEFYFKF